MKEEGPEFGTPEVTAIPPRSAALVRIAKREVESMGKFIGGLILVIGIWVGVEIMTTGPSQAFGGLFAGFTSSSETGDVDNRSAARRAGDAVARARDEATARRERMLAE